MWIAIAALGGVVIGFLALYFFEVIGKEKLQPFEDEELDEYPDLSKETDIKFETETSGGDLPLNRRPTAAEIVKRAIRDNARKNRNKANESFQLGPGSKVEFSDEDSTEDEIKL